MGAEPRSVWEIVLDAFAAHAARDWDGFKSFLHDDVVLVDHRPVSLGRLEGPSAVVGSLEALAGIVPDIQFRPSKIHAMDAERVLFENALVGSAPEDGGRVEIGLLTLLTVREGRARELEFFAVDKLEEALSRFEVLSPRGDAVD